jgi:hypothetical protein
MVGKVLFKLLQTGMTSSTVGGQMVVKSLPNFRKYLLITAAQSYSPADPEAVRMMMLNHPMTLPPGTDHPFGDNYDCAVIVTATVAAYTALHRQRNLIRQINEPPPAIGAYYSETHVMVVGLERPSVGAVEPFFLEPLEHDIPILRTRSGLVSRAGKKVRTICM